MHFQTELFNIITERVLSSTTVANEFTIFVRFEVFITEEADF